MTAWATIRRKPYTERGVRRKRCMKCGEPATTQWRVCADGSWRPVCADCDVALNYLVLRWFGHPEPLRAAIDYERRAFPWVSESMQCDGCGHEWVAVHEHVESMECPACGHRVPSKLEMRTDAHFTGGLEESA